MTTPMPAWLESAWLARYLDRQLSDDEAASFEAYLLDKPWLLEMVEADSSLRNALNSGEAVSRIAPSAEQRTLQGTVDSSWSPSVAPTASVKAPTNNESAWRTLAAAASLVLGLGLGWVGGRAVPWDNDTAAIIANPQRVVFDTMRGEAAEPHIDFADIKSMYVLVEVAVPVGAENISLHIEKRNSVPLTPSADGFVSFLLRTSDLNNPAKTIVQYTVGGRTQSREIFPAKSLRRAQ